MMNGIASTSPPGFELLNEEGKTELLEILDSLRGKKCLVTESDLRSLLTQTVFAGDKELRDNGVQYFRDLIIENIQDFISASGRDVPDHIVFIVKPHLGMMKILSWQVREYLKSGLRCQYHVYFIPHRTVACEQMLEDEGVLEHVKMGEYHLGLVPFDSDVLTLEMGLAYKHCYVDGDTSALSVIAKALHRFQSIYGIIPNVKGKGNTARKILQKMMRLRVEEETARNAMGSSSSSSAAAGGMGPLALDTSSGSSSGAHRREIDTLVIFDRDIDIASALITPLTYEGLIDEIIGIERGIVNVPASIVGDESTSAPAAEKGGTQQQSTIKGSNPSSSSSSTASGSNNEQAQAAVNDSSSDSVTSTAAEKLITINLDSSDSIYSEIRDLSIERLGGYLQERAIGVRKRYAAFRENKDASISEIHDFVKKIPQLTKEYKSLNQHINIAELVKKITDSREFRERWQGERGLLEGEGYLDQLEDLISVDLDRKYMLRNLRLLCLQSVTAGGIRSGKYDSIRRQFIQAYGYEMLFTLNNLERAGLLRRKDMVLMDSTSPWQASKRLLRLIEDNSGSSTAAATGSGTSSMAPSSSSQSADISFVAAGYAPLSVKLLQMLCEAEKRNANTLTTGTGIAASVSTTASSSASSSSSSSYPSAARAGSWQFAGVATEALKALPGPLVEFIQLETMAEELSDAVARYNASLSSSSQASTAVTDGDLFGDGTAKKHMVVFIVGGLTFLEIAAFRHLSKDPNFPYTIALATTKLVNGNTFMKLLQ